MKKKISRRSFLSISAMTAAAITLDWDKVSAWAARMGPGVNYPTAIIGAGLGGLCCGALLSKMGVPVTIVEQHSVPGGYATSFERAAGRFSFEVSLHGTSISNNATARILENIGILDRLELVELPEVYRIKSKTHDIVVPQRDPEAYIQILTGLFPSEAAGIRGFVNEMIDLHNEVDAYSRKSETTKKWTRLLFPIQNRRMWKIRNETLQDFMDRFTANRKLQDILASLWGYYGLPPSKLSGFYYANATGGYLKNGSFSIRERSQNLSNALADVIAENGGSIRYDTKVERINTSNRKVSGITLSGGETLAARAVVSNASARTTLTQMIPRNDLPDDYHKRLSSLRPSISSFIVWLGLNREIKGTVKGFSTHVASGHGPETDYRACLNGAVDTGSFSVSAYDNIYEGYSAPGTSSVMLLFLCGYEPWKRFEKDYRDGNKALYRREKVRWTRTLIQRAEEAVIPGLSTMTEVVEAATPLTNARYTGNTEGAIYGFEQSMQNAFMNRIDNRTPIEGLYLAGAWGSPGGGYAGVLLGGQDTFQKMMQDWGA